MTTPEKSSEPRSIASFWPKAVNWPSRRLTTPVPVTSVRIGAQRLVEAQPAGEAGLEAKALEGHLLAQAHLQVVEDEQRRRLLD